MNLPLQVSKITPVPLSRNQVLYMKILCDNNKEQLVKCECQLALKFPSSQYNEWKNIDQEGSRLDCEIELFKSLLPFDSLPILTQKDIGNYDQFYCFNGIFDKHITLENQREKKQIVHFLLSGLKFSIIYDERKDIQHTICCDHLSLLIKETNAKNHVRITLKLLK